MELNPSKAIAQALAHLAPRQREIVQLRYGLKSGAGETLAAIGKRYNVTRERIRQIEAQALRSLRAQFAKAEFDGFRKEAAAYLERHMGLRRPDLVSSDMRENGAIIRCAFEASGVASFNPEDKAHYAFWSLSDAHVKKGTAYITDLVTSMKRTNGRSAAMPTDEVGANYVSISKKFAVSPHGEFGLAEWRDINPKVSRDWAFLVLKKAAAPLHFSQITTEINKLRKSKKVNPQTIHNELIKDKRFILVGRGMYGLEEFGILPGTAREVLTHLLKKHGAMPAKAIVGLALTHRPFKEKTLLINLQNKNWFKRMDGGDYFVRKA
jgi:hypothetical protein